MKSVTAVTYPIIRLGQYICIKMQLSLNDRRILQKKCWISTFSCRFSIFSKLLTRPFLIVSSKCNFVWMIQEFCKNAESALFYAESAFFQNCWLDTFWEWAVNATVYEWYTNFEKNAESALFNAESAFFQNCWLSTFLREDWTVNATIYQFAKVEGHHMKSVVYIIYNRYLGGHAPWVTPRFWGRVFIFNRLPVMVITCLHIGNEVARCNIVTCRVLTR